MPDHKHHFPHKQTGNARPQTMREHHYSLTPAERKAQRDLFADPYMEVRVERLRQQYRDAAADDPSKAEGLAEMLALLDELQDVNKEMREYFFKEIPEARPHPRDS